MAVPGPGGSTEFGSDWAVILRANRQCCGSDVAVLWQGMDQSEGRKPLHAMEHRGSAAGQCFGSDGSAAPLTEGYLRYIAV